MQLNIQIVFRAEKFPLMQITVLNISCELCCCVQEQSWLFPVGLYNTEYVDYNGRCSFYICFADVHVIIILSM